MHIEPAPDVQKMLKSVVRKLALTHIDTRAISCMRSREAKSRARARIWSFPRIWQIALSHPPHYVIEVLSQHFDKLTVDNKVRVIIHELMHIPRNFSGALVPHRGRYYRINSRSVENLFNHYKNNQLRKYD